jgi:hypothetical protein
MIMNPNHKPPAEHAPSAGQRAVDELYICVLCASRLVYPFRWVAEGPQHWRVFLRCPDCEAIREGLFTQQAVDLLADELDRGSGVLIKALDRLTRENMNAEIEILVRALEEDVILPSDF